MNRLYLTLKYRIERFPNHKWVYLNTADRDSLYEWLVDHGMLVMLVQSVIGIGPEIDIGVYVDGSIRFDKLCYHLLEYEQRTT